MSIDKLKKCRICLVENVRMFVVADKNLQEIYEKLTDVPFVTEDIRPMLACFLCCSKLKQCYQLQRKCLEAEELFAQMLNNDYETKSQINQDPFELSSGFNITPSVHISVVDACQAESIAIKEELPDVCEELEVIIEPKQEPRSDELELEHLDNSCLHVADIPPYHSASNLEDDVPVMEFKIEVEEEQDVSENKRRAREMTRTTVAKKPKLDTGRTKVDAVTAEQTKNEISDSKVIQIIQKRANVAKKPKLDTQNTTLEDAITAKQTKKEKFDSKVIRITQKPTSKPGAYFKEPYKCDQRGLNPVKKMKQHSRTQLGEVPYKCDVCQRSFSEKRYLTKHKRIHTGKKPFKCDVCQRSFTEKSTLTKHIRQHTGEKPYNCDVCQRSFSEKGVLINHIRVHTGEKPFKCYICERSFRQLCHVKKHILIHTGEKLYKCDVCQRSFSEKGHLTIHIRIHTGEKPYKCDVCQRNFSRKGILTNHIRTHTGEKPYKCDTCGRCFSSKVHVKKHSRTHT